MEIKIKNHLKEDLIISSKKRNITIELLIEQILSTAMLVESYLTSEDSKKITDIYKKYIHKIH